MISPFGPTGASCLIPFAKATSDSCCHDYQCCFFHVNFLPLCTLHIFLYYLCIYFTCIYCSSFKELSFAAWSAAIRLSMISSRSPSENCIQTVQCQFDPVICHTSLWEIVGTDLLGTVSGTDLASSCLSLCIMLLLPVPSHTDVERRTFSALSLFLSCDFSSWQEITIPVGIWVRRTAESVVLTHCPPFPDARNTSNLQSFISRWKSISSASGMIATVMVEVWIRPPDSVSGTRCTRCTPLSYFSLE